MKALQTNAPKQKLPSAKSYISLTGAAKLVQASLFTENTPLTEPSIYDRDPKYKRGEIPSIMELKGMIFRDITGEVIPNLKRKVNRTERYPLRFPMSTSIMVTAKYNRKEGGEVYIGVGDFLNWAFNKRELIILTCYLSGLRPNDKGEPIAEIPDAQISRFNELKKIEEGVYFYENPYHDMINHKVDFNIDLGEFIEHDEVEFTFQKALGYAKRNVRVMSELYLTMNEAVTETKEVFLDLMEAHPVGEYYLRDVVTDLGVISELSELDVPLDMLKCHKIETEDGGFAYKFDWTRRLLLPLLVNIAIDDLQEVDSFELFKIRDEEDLADGDSVLPPDPKKMLFRRETFCPLAYSK